MRETRVLALEAWHSLLPLGARTKTATALLHLTLARWCWQRNATLLLASCTQPLLPAGMPFSLVATSHCSCRLGRSSNWNS